MALGQRFVRIAKKASDTGRWRHPGLYDDVLARGGVGGRGGVCAHRGAHGTLRLLDLFPASVLQPQQKKDKYFVTHGEDDASVGFVSSAVRANRHADVTQMTTNAVACKYS